MGEIPVQPHESGALNSALIRLDPSYKNQVFFKLRTNSIVRTVLKTDWDIAFESRGGNYIFLNSSKSMFIRNTGIKDFDAVRDTAGFAAAMRCDAPGGDPDSTGAGPIELNTVYIIDRGYSELALHQGFRKMQVLSADEEAWRIQFSEMSGKKHDTALIRRDARFNRIAFSFKTGTVAEIEPERNAFDLIFTQYTHIFHEPFQPYLVTGVLQNRGVLVAIDSVRSFSDISRSDTSRYMFSAGLNSIGYNWKEYNFTTNSFTVNSRITYIIRDLEGYYYKLHFTDFYNSAGEKGYPGFEYSIL